MTKTTVNPNFDATKESFENLKKVLTSAGWAPLLAMIVSGVAKYGVHIFINHYSKHLTRGARLHQRIAIQVATFLVIWACQDKIKKIAYEVTAELFEALKTVLNFVKGATTA